MTGTVPKEKYLELLKDYNRLIDITNKTEEMFEALDTYRKSKDKRDLFQTHGIELQLRRSIKEEADRLEQNQPKLKVA